MKTLKIAFTLFFVSTLSHSSFADTQNYIIYTQGTLAGQLVEDTGYLGYERACYNGNPWIVRKHLLKMAQEDSEKENVTVWYNQKLVQIEFSYVSTKCLDDTFNATDEDCANTVIIPSCE